MKIVFVFLVLLQVAVSSTKYVQNWQGVDLKSVGPNVRPVERMTPSAIPSFTFETEAMKGNICIEGGW